MPLPSWSWCQHGCSVVDFSVNIIMLNTVYMAF